MSSLVAAADVEAGVALPELAIELRRTNLVVYAGASGDFNPLHWSDRVAGDAGLPDVIAHGMLTMGVAGRVVTDWVQDPGAVVSYECRFSRPVVVPDDDRGATVFVSGVVRDLDDTGRATVDLTVSAASTGEAPNPVLQQAVAVVQLS